MLSDLGNYGGSTQTHALMTGSPAIDAGDTNDCPNIDQRGTARPVDGGAAAPSNLSPTALAPNIGAFEFLAPTSAGVEIFRACSFAKR